MNSSPYFSIKTSENCKLDSFLSPLQRPHMRQSSTDFFSDCNNFCPPNQRGQGSIGSDARATLLLQLLGVGFFLMSTVKFNLVILAESNLVILADDA
jgi:hypothetical protein